MQLAIYGKGGIGKSTVTSNLSAAFSKLGKEVLQIGCDPKSDSIKLLVNGKKYETILGALRGNRKIEVKDLIYTGFNGVKCCESGGPEPGVGCAGRGVIKAFEILGKSIDLNDYDVVAYDVLGDVVCGGFAMPMRLGYAKDIIIVISGELMSIYAANNIMKAIRNYNEASGVKLLGVILNCRNVKNEVEIAKKFCDLTGANLLGVIPRSQILFECDYKNEVVFNEFKDSDESMCFLKIATNILNSEKVLPKPLMDEDFDSFVKKILNKS